jgi:hypothetical protein
MKSSKSIITLIIGLAIIFVLIIALPGSTAMADSAGPSDPGKGSNLEGIGTEAWVNPGNITSPGSPYATVTLYQGHQYSNYLRGSEYGFNIPPEGSITGIEVTISRYSNSHNPNVIDNVVQLVDDTGTRVGENKAVSTNWPTTITSVSYGGPTDLWGATWTPAKVNSLNFGVDLAAYRDNHGNNQRSAVVDSMQITVYYVYTSSMAVACGDESPVTYGDSIICEVTVTALLGAVTPDGVISWTSEGSGSFEPNPCSLEGADGTASCETTYTPSAVGTGLHKLTASYDGGTVFAPNSATHSVNVVQRPLAVTALPKSKVFGSDDPELTFDYTPELAFNDTFTGTLVRDAGEDVGGYAINQGTLTVTVDYDLTYFGDFLEITPAEAACTIEGWSGVYDGESHGATGECLGVDDNPLEGLDLGNTFINVPGGTANWSFTDSDGNYMSTNGNVAIEITKRSITVTADAKSKLAGQADPELTYKVSVGSVVDGDDFTGALARQAGEKPGIYAILQGTLALTNNYEITYVGANFTILGNVIYLPMLHK